MKKLVFLLCLFSPFTFAQLDVSMDWIPDLTVAGYEITYPDELGESYRFMITNEAQTNVIIPFTVAGTYEVIMRCFCANDRYCKSITKNKIVVIDGSTGPGISFTLTQISDNTEPVVPCLDNCVIDPIDP